QAGGHDGRLRDQERHGLPLHVGTHEGAVGVVVFQERDQPGGDADHLLGRDVDELHLVGTDVAEVAAETGDDALLVDLGAGAGRVGGGRVDQRLLVGAERDHFLGQLPLVDLAVGRDQEAVVVHAGVNTQAGDQADVGPFRRLDRADAAVVGNVHV